MHMDNVGTRPWGDELPDLVLYDIVRRLDCVSTYVKFACVCRSWRDFAKAAAVDFVPSRPPMLVHFIEAEAAAAAQDCKVIFYGLPENKIYHKRVQGIAGLRYVGHSCGWLIMIRRTTSSCTDQKSVVLLNPFTGAKIMLPSLEQQEDFSPVPVRAEEEDCIEAGALSMPPTSSDCIIFLVSAHHIFYYYRSDSAATDSSGWRCRILDRPGWMANLVDVLFLKNRVYANTWRYLVAVMDIHADGNYTFLSMTYPLPSVSVGDRTVYMEIGGELWAFSMFFVNRHLYSQTFSGRLDSSEGKWVQSKFDDHQQLFLFSRGTWRRHEEYRTCQYEHVTINSNVLEQSSKFPDLHVKVRLMNYLEFMGGWEVMMERKCRKILVSSSEALPNDGTKVLVREAWLSPQNYI